MEQRAEIFYYIVWTPSGPVVKHFTNQQDRNRFADQDADANEDLFFNRTGSLMITIDDYGPHGADLDPTYDAMEYKAKDDLSGCPSPSCDCPSPSCS